MGREEPDFAGRTIEGEEKDDELEEEEEVDDEEDDDEDDGEEEEEDDEDDDKGEWRKCSDLLDGVGAVAPFACCCGCCDCRRLGVTGDSDGKALSKSSSLLFVEPGIVVKPLESENEDEEAGEENDENEDDEDEQECVEDDVVKGNDDVVKGNE